MSSPSDRTSKLSGACRLSQNPSDGKHKAPMAERLGVDETQAIHHALRDLAAKVLPQYAQDDGALSAAQVRQIRKHVPQGAKRSVRSSLLELESV